MRAIQVTRFGGPEVLVASEAPKPVAGPGQAMVDVSVAGQLFLVGDSAHIVPPASAKGANLALHDADILASAIREYVVSGSRKALDAYSDVCLENTWNYQEYTVWISDMIHEAGDASISGPFRQKIARARFDRLFRSPTALRQYSEFMAGTN